MQMYKVFINEKKISLTNEPLKGMRSLLFDNETSVEIILDLMENTSTPEVCLYHPDLEVVWNGFRDFFKNVGAAGGIVSNDEGKVLFIKRLGRWDLPKGKIEKGEQTEDAAVREVQEETGLDELTVEYFVGKTYHIYSEKSKKILKTTHWYKMKFTGVSEATPQVEEGITEVSWKSEKQIREQVHHNTFENIRYILDQSFSRE